MADTMTRLTSVIRQVFDDDGIAVRPETTAADIEGWDSINHVNLVLAVEREFKRTIVLVRNSRPEERGRTGQDG
jgi:acyl carrier protein